MMQHLDVDLDVASWKSEATSSSVYAVICQSSLSRPLWQLVVADLLVACQQ